MNTPEYADLSAAIRELEQNLLGFAQKDIEPYTTEELLKCQAYVVFSHAEIQVYFETIARRILREAESRWTTDRTIDRVIAALCVYRKADRISIPVNPIEPEPSADVEKIVEAAIRKQADVIADNNGIKRANIASLLCPLGVFQWDLNEAFLIQSDQTGKKRGELVHKSSRVALRMIRDPFFDEKGDIDNLLIEIALIDQKLQDIGLLS